MVPSSCAHDVTNERTHTWVDKRKLSGWESGIMVAITLTSCSTHSGGSTRLLWETHTGQVPSVCTHTLTSVHECTCARAGGTLEMGTNLCTHYAQRKQSRNVFFPLFWESVHKLHSSMTCFSCGVCSCWHVASYCRMQSVWFRALQGRDLCPQVDGMSAQLRGDVQQRDKGGFTPYKLILPNKRHRFIDAGWNSFHE